MLIEISRLDVAKNDGRTITVKTGDTVRMAYPSDHIVSTEVITLFLIYKQSDPLRMRETCINDEGFTEIVFDVIGPGQVRKTISKDSPPGPNRTQPKTRILVKAEM